MMNNETIDAILQHEGYEIRNGLELFDTVGQFVTKPSRLARSLMLTLRSILSPMLSAVRWPGGGACNFGVDLSQDSCTIVV